MNVIASVPGLADFAGEAFGFMRPGLLSLMIYTMSVFSLPARTLSMLAFVSPNISMPETSIFTDVFRSYLPEPHASLLSGILFGEKLKTSAEFYRAVKQTGLLHIVVLSGINITLLGAMISIFTKNLGRKLSSVITICSIVIFVIFVGPDPPVTRAAIMGSLTLLAIVYERKTLALYMLFLSALIIAVVKWEWIGTVSFQLSFGATLGIMLFGNVPAREPAGLRGRMLGLMEKELRPSVSAQIITIPIIFWYFKEISLIAPLSNLAVAFIIPPLMIFGMITAILGKLHPILGVLPAYICYGLLHYVVLVIYAMSRIPHIFLDFG